MDYGGILRRALDIAWHQRWLWLLALLAGESSLGASFNYRYGAPARPRGSSRVELAPVAAWISSHAGLLIAAGIAALVIIVVLFLVSVVAEAGAVRGVAALDAAQAAGLGRAWRMGAQVMWPMLALRLLVLVIALALVLVLAGLIAAAIVAGAVLHAVLAAAILGFESFTFGLLLIPVAVAAGPIVKLAARELALGGAGPWAALRGAVLLTARRLGPVALLWVIEFACGIAVGLVFLLVAGLMLVPVILTGFETLAGRAPAELVWLGVYAAVAIAVLVVASAAVAAFFSAYWTLAYRRLIALA